MNSREPQESLLLSLLRWLEGPAKGSARIPIRRDASYFQDIRDAPDPTLTLDLLRQIDWKNFEEVCAEYLRLMGFVATTQSHGPDGGIDITLAMPDAPDKVVGLVQVKQWSSQVGPKLVRELLGVMANAKVSEGMFITTSKFNVEAQVFAEANGIDLVDGERLLHLMMKHPPAAQQQLLRVAMAGDYLTPTCAACGVKFIRRKARTGKEFWGCRNYPRCKLTIDR
jgi:restriction system protein